MFNTAFYYLKGVDQLRQYGCIGITYDHCIFGPKNGVNRALEGMGSGQSNNPTFGTVSENLIEYCTFYCDYQEGVNSQGGVGDTGIGDVGQTTIRLPRPGSRNSLASDQIPVLLALQI